MAFDQYNVFVRPGNFEFDRSRGDNFTAERIDQELADIARALTELKAAIPSNPAIAYDPARHPTVVGMNAALATKQNALGFTPVDQATVGQPSGVAPIGPNGLIPSQYLPAAGATVGNVVNSVNGKTGVVGLDSNDIATALGFDPANVSHTHPMIEINGLNTALNSKEPKLGFVPARESHTHIISQVEGLQAIVDNIPQVYTDNDIDETTFPKGHTLLVALEAGSSVDDTPGEIGTYKAISSYVPVERNQLKIVRLSPTIRTNSSNTIISGGSGSGAPKRTEYTTAPAGTILVGQWRSRGAFGALALFERVA